MNHRRPADPGASRGEEAPAAWLLARHAMHLEAAEQHAARRLCTSRATKRAARDQRRAQGA